jgi:polyhydroxybutyrate depolymerase
MKKLALVLCLLVCVAHAQKGKFTTHTKVWNKLTRTYSVYVPPVLQEHPALVIAMHGTTVAAETDPPLTICTQSMGWNALADANGFLVVCPISTYIPGGPDGGRFFWESYGREEDFPDAPDDSGFLRSLVIQVEKPVSAGGYGVDLKRVFVTGFSSGGMMTQRMCVANADVVAACAPESGPLWVGNPNIVIPSPSQPVSIMELHGDEDTTVPYCGGQFWTYAHGLIPVPGVDVDVDFWLKADGLGPNTTPLCTSGDPSPSVFGVDFKSANDKTEVQFVRELGFAHTYKTWTASTTWEFFAAHGR